jgi:hypothetical protein
MADLVLHEKAMKLVQKNDIFGASRDNPREGHQNQTVQVYGQTG